MFFLGPFEMNIKTISDTKSKARYGFRRVELLWDTIFPSVGWLECALSVFFPISLLTNFQLVLLRISKLLHAFSEKKQPPIKF